MPAKSELRVGLVGYGSWTRSAYLPALRRDGRARVVAVVARKETTRERACVELGSGVATFARLEDAPDSLDIDALLIAVPDSMHEPVLTTALAGRAAILYEPPLSDQRVRIAPMIERLERSALVTYADLELGFIPAVARVAEIAGSGGLGPIQSASIRLQAGWGPVANYDLCNIDHLSTWYVDVLNRILGATPSRVLVLDGRGAPGRRQSRNIAHFDYAGVWGTLDVNIACVGDLAIDVRVNGSEGDLEADLLSGGVRWRTRSHPAWIEENHAALQPVASWPGMHESVSEFLNAVERGRATVNNASSSARLHRIGLAAEQSVETGGWAPIYL
jgi:predicted dehydrogenase